MSYCIDAAKRAKTRRLFVDVAVPHRFPSADSWFGVFWLHFAAIEQE
jgi:hypothetical protein